MEDKCPNCGKPMDKCICGSDEKKSGGGCSCCGHPCEPDEK